MAIATTDGHVSRALDFYNKAANTYFIIGGSQPWTDESAPDDALASNTYLRDIIGLKKVDNMKLVVQDDTGSIVYRTNHWKSIDSSNVFKKTTAAASVNDTSITINSAEGIQIGNKIRINHKHTVTITAISGNTITFAETEKLTEAVPSGSDVVAGAIAEGAHHVYLECRLEFDIFPATASNSNALSYRQIGICTGVVPKTYLSNTIENSTNVTAGPGPADVNRQKLYQSHGILLAKNSSVASQTDIDNMYDSLGMLEILDNRTATSRDANQQEVLSLIIEF